MNPEATVQLPAAKKKARVLLVEDEANIASMVQDWLAEKYDVVVADNGKAALQKALSEKPDIILQDIHLPDMTGFDVVKVLEKDSKTNQVPVIFLTGEKMVEETVKFISTVKNVKGYVNKPFRLKDFLEKIDQILSHQSEFVVLENRASAPQNPMKAELVREARAQDGKGPAGGKRPVIPVPGASAASGPGGNRGFFRSLVSVVFRLAFWGLWTALAAAAGGELACRAVELFVGKWVFLPPRAPAVAASFPGAPPPGAVWEQDGVTYRINALGLRDREPETLSTGTFHSVVLGGTALFGGGVPLNETFSKRLESFFDNAAVFASTGSHRVVHGALWGLSPAGQWTAYEHLHPRLKPDLLVWGVGDPHVRRPSQRRLEVLNAWPAWVPPRARSWPERSRLAALLAMLYVYGDVVEEPSMGADFQARINRFMEANPGTALMVLNLDKEEALSGLAPRDNLFVFDVSKVVGLDQTWKGLSPRGHEYLARAAFPLLQKYAGRIKPGLALPAPASPAGPKPARRISAPGRR